MLLNVHTASNSESESAINMTPLWGTMEERIKEEGKAFKTVFRFQP
jgi:hypothetical protein